MKVKTRRTFYDFPEQYGIAWHRQIYVQKYVSSST